MEVRSEEHVWYTRREGVIRGPFVASHITRCILLGRIRFTDELRGGTGDWRPVSRCEALIPEEMRLPLTPGNEARLERARMEADERTPGDRRNRDPDPGPAIRERRSGVERRRPESARALRFREMRARGEVPDEWFSSGWRRRGVPLLAGLAVMLAAWWWLG